MLLAKYQDDMTDWEKRLNDCDPGRKNNVPCWTSNEQSGDDWKQMNLPGAWEHNGLPDFDGYVWFQIVVDIPSEWE